MNTEEQKLSRDLIVTPPNGVRRISRDEFAHRFPLALEDGKVALRLFEEAYREKNAEDLQCALIIGAAFGFGPEHTDILGHLVESDWHFSHEDIVSALDGLRDPAAVSALYSATQWVPEYLNFDESRALAVKAIWALGKIYKQRSRRKAGGAYTFRRSHLEGKCAGQIK